MKSYRAALAFALAGTLLGAAGCTDDAGIAETPDAPADSARPPAVLGASDVEPARRLDLIAGIPISGPLQPSVDVRISASTSEVLQEVMVREGDRVRKGQALARFNTQAFAPAAASAETRRRVAATDFGRMQNLFKEGAVSEKDVENAELALRAAEAEAAQAQRRLEQSTVRAPVSGVISERLVDAGDRPGDGDALFQLVNTQVLELEASFPSQYVGQVRRGAPVSLTVTGLDNVTVGGKVSRINATADPATRQVKAYVTVPNTDNRLVGGLFASGRVVLDEARGVLGISREGVRGDTAEAHVLVVKNDRVMRRPVKTGLTDEVQGMVEIREGLIEGDTVIVGPAEGLREGDVVQIVGREA